MIEEINPTYLREIEKLLPEEFTTVGAQIKESRDLLFYKEGDFANDIYDYVNNTKTHALTRFGACWIAARLTGEETRVHTIYEHARVAGRIPNQEHRETYSLLPFKHLRYATQFEDYVTILNVALEQSDIQGGKPPSANALKEAHEKAIENGEKFATSHFDDARPSTPALIRTALDVLRSLQQVFAMLSRFLTKEEMQELEEINKTTQKLIDRLRVRQPKS